MTGKPDFNFPLFNQTEKVLFALGYNVVNPAQLNPEPEKPWIECMKVDIRALLDCDGIFMLPGHRESKGASLELQIALALGLQCYHGFDDLVARGGFNDK